MSRIRHCFDGARKANRAALIAYITAGDPCPERTPALVAALERGGTDLIELGVPFSDPIADGPVIQRGSERALKAGTTVARVLDIARCIRAHSDIPIVLFSYLNPLLRYGFEKLAARAAEIGIDGLLLTDLSIEEAPAHVPALHARGLDTIFLAAPTSTPERLDAVARYSSGFIYLVSQTGVTGERQDLSNSIASLAGAMRTRTDLPLAVGFGISTPDQAAAVARLADGVIVGSAFVRIVEQQSNGPGVEDRLEQFTRSLADRLGRTE
jgi:tryptophan synthase alpha chain